METRKQAAERSQLVTSPPQASNEDVVQPEDSASQVNSSLSSSSSVNRRRLDVIRQSAELKAQLAVAKEMQSLELEELKIRQRRLEMDNKVKLAALTEEERLLTTTQSALDPVAGNMTPTVVVNNEQDAIDTEVCFPNLAVENENLSPVIDVADNTHKTVIHDSNQDLINAIRLPQAQLVTFDGDALKFWTFIRAFEHAVENCTNDNAARLTRLIAYCAGKARKVIECCSVMDPDQGYPRAKSLLKQRFGNDFVIAEAWVRKVTTGKPIGPQDKERLQDLADDLHSCIETLSAMNYVNELTNQSTLLKIAEQLPTYLQARVKRELCRLRDAGSVPDINFLARLIREGANEANDPVYGKLGMRYDKVPANHGKMLPNRHSTSVATSAAVKPHSGRQSSGNSERQQPRSCPMCGESHTLFECQRFKSLSVHNRVSFVKEHRLCFNCLLPNHQSSNCPLTRRCTVNGCGKRHTKFLHVVNREASAEQQEQTVNRTPQLSTVSGVTSVTTGLTGAGVSKNALPIVPVIARNPVTMTEIVTYALLDNGSTHSFISSEIMQQLNIHGTAEILNLTTLHADRKSVETTLVSVELCSLDKAHVIEIPEVFVAEKIPVSIRNKAEPDEIKTWSHLIDIHLPEVDSSRVGLLIGQNCPDVFVPLEIRRGEFGSPYAVRTVFGWTVNGPVGRLPGQRRMASVNFVQSDSGFECQIERLWMLDTVPESTSSPLSVNDRKTLDIWNESIRQHNGHYELAIPFRKRPPTLPDNLEPVTQRLIGLRRKLLRDPKLHVKYIAYMNDLIAKGHAEKATSTPDAGNVWYLPHHSVNNANKPDKVRVVFDCSAKCNGTSLNENVFQGPDMMNKLIGVLLRFREEPVAFTADIEAMFHQVNVSVEDRDFLRFLWWPNGDLNMEPETYRMTVHLFGGIWSPSCCNYVLRHAVEQRRLTYGEEVTRTVLRNFYVDDCLKSVASEDKALSLIQGLRSVLQECGFNLTKWTSNSAAVLSAIPESDRSTSSSVNLQESDILFERALGVRWEPEGDIIGFTSVNKDKPLSRRGILSIVNSVYDPLGLISPFVLPAKRIIQELCRKGIGWDDCLPANELEAWQSWQREQQKLNLLKVNRCVRPSSVVVATQLHHFCDASQYAYGVASYVRSVEADGQVSCHLLMSRSRLAPMKALTIPRLELTAATLAVKIDKLIRHEIDITIDSSFFWTDSTIVLQYIYNDDRRFHTFVANRVTLIRENSIPRQWRHIDSQLNPADDASRGLNAEQLVNSDRWFRGPSFLMDKEDTWPTSPVIDIKPLQDDPEVKHERIVYINNAIATSQLQHNIFDRLFNRYSDWFQLRLTVAWLLRCRQFLLARIKHQQPPDMKKAIMAFEIRHSELQIVKYVQHQAFSNEVHELNQTVLPCKSVQPVPNVKATASQIHRLEPILVSGVLRIGGRLQSHPIILPKVHPVVTLIIRHFHILSCHAGREHVVSLIRRHYWIIKCRLAVRRVLSDCMTCKRLKAKPLSQRMADLPDDRVTPGQPPFTRTGVDIFGPFSVKRGRSEVKRYGCLFTCLTIRAIHIEVVHSLETDSFLQALQRFICRRGQVKVIRSDNGTNFVGAHNELCAAMSSMNQDRINKYLCHRGIEWHFNTPLASHMGGVWERQIRSIRKILATLLKEQTLDDERLCTFMCIVESVVNSRPITVISDDHSDPEPLTPNHLLLLQGQVSLPSGEFDDKDIYSRKRWRQVQYLADVFWRRWSREYLPTLQLRQKWHESVRNLEVGDIIILVDERLPRNIWRLGRVVETYPSSDGLVRTVKVKTKSTEGSLVTLIRPIHKLCLLETVKSQTS